MFSDYTTTDWVMHGVIFAMGMSSIGLGVLFGWVPLRRWLAHLERRVDKILNQQLLLDIPPRLAIGLAAMLIFGFGIVCAALLKSPLWFFVGAGSAAVIPTAMVRIMERRRLKKLNEQIVDGITTLASGVRAGLNLVQSFQLLVKNATGPIQQEVRQMMREYELGTDLNQAMRNTSARIGSSYYRLLFAAIEAHRQRGGDMGESLDRIAESIREIQRLEGRLDALTAQGRAQARMIGVMPFVIIVIYWWIDPEGVERLLVEPAGRVILLIAAAMIAAGFLWIRRIMQVDI